MDLPVAEIGCTNPIIIDLFVKFVNQLLNERISAGMNQYKYNNIDSQIINTFERIIAYNIDECEMNRMDDSYSSSENSAEYAVNK